MANKSTKAHKIDWGRGQELQQDSYATGRELIHSYLMDDHIVIEITDGSSAWKERIALPKDWKT